MKRKIESQLLAWKEKETGRMPLILGGARQIGKTYILREFGRAHFKNTAYLNLETNQKMVEYFQDGIVPERLLRYILSLIHISIHRTFLPVMRSWNKKAARIITKIGYSPSRIAARDIGK